MIRILTDSTADLDPGFAAQMDVTVVPLRVLFDGESFRDGIDLSADAFYDRLAHSQQLPTTSQPTPDDFLPYFLAAKEAGDSLVAILLSAAISGTVQSALIAKEMAEYDGIYVIDSMTTITGQRLLVGEACKLRAQGMAAEEMVAALEAMKHRVVLYAIFDTLEYLYKGGRLSRVGMVAGSLLNLKPIITFSEGALKVAGKSRGTGKSVHFIPDAMERTGVASCSPILFGYSASDEKLRILRDAVLARYSSADTSTAPVGSVVGTHAGPGAAAISYLMP